MSHDLRDPFDDLVVEVPRHVDADPRAAWAAGARRRTRRRVGGGAAVLALLALATTVVAAPPVSLAPAQGPRPAVDGYPVRIEHSFWVRELPARPGPLAGIIQARPERVSWGRSLGWYAVSPDGSLHALPDAREGYYPALSDDGTRLGYLTGSGYEIHDLVTGEVTRFPEVGDGIYHYPEEDHDTDHRYQLAGQAPSWWSSDGTALYLPGGETDPGSRSRGLVLTPTGGLQVVVPSRGGWNVAGWTPDGSLAWLGWDRLPAGRRAELLLTAPDGTVRRELRLTGAGRGFGQWAGRLSPDGTRIAVLGAGSTRVATVSVRTRRLLADSDLWGDGEVACPLAWRRGTVAVPGGLDDRGAALVAAEPTSTGTARTLVAADPRLGVGCSMWAVDALAGEPGGGLAAAVLGTSTAWPSWWWREATAAGLAVVAAALLVVRRRRRGALSG